MFIADIIWLDLLFVDSWEVVNKVKQKKAIATICILGFLCIFGYTLNPQHRMP